MLDHAVLYHRNNFVLIRHLTEENKYSLGTAQMYEGYKNNTDCFPVSESFISAEEMIDRMKAWQEIDVKYKDINNTFAAEQEIIEVLEQELIKETDIMIDFKKIISELNSKDVHLCSVISKIHDWGLCLEDNEKDLYQMERYYFHSYPNHLIENGAVVKFELVDASISKDVADWERNVWKISDVENFLKRYGLEQKSSLDEQINETAKNEEWIVTDPDDLQIRRQVYVDNPKVFELMQVDTWPMEEKTLYKLAVGEIDLNDYSEEEIKSALDSYGYDNMEALVSAVGSEKEACGQLAEMLFETYTTEFYVCEFDSFNAAADEVERRTGIDLSGLKEAEQSDLESVIKACSEMSKDGKRDITEKGTIDKDAR